MSWPKPPLVLTGILYICNMKTNRHILGEIAEAKVLGYLMQQGYRVYLPFSDNGPVDMIAYKEDKLIRVSVKGTSRLNSKKGWRITLCTTSRRKTGVAINYFDKTSCDVIAAYIEPLDKVILIDVKKIDVKREIAVNPEDSFRIYGE